ncbi:Rap1a/Tai family immunity protein [Methyloglobulus morosus]|nr:Rap1a/Tai family immunity protein [Methyloglobulus morosus]
MLLITSGCNAGVVEKGVEPSSSITVDNVNLTARQFFTAYTSPNEPERDRAMLYLLGVLDATEKKSWCDYSTLKTITIRENIFEYFKKLPSDRLKNRASSVIEESLHSLFPCGGRK